MKNIAVVTGASSGIGREFARQIVQRYPKLDGMWIIGRNEERLWQLQAELPVEVRIFQMDLTSEESIGKLTAELAKENPKIRILVNSAGFGKLGNFAGTSCQEAVRMVEINCVALTCLTYACLPYMPAKSRILQMGSSAAFTPQPGFAVYAATKAYVLSFSRALARELRSRDIWVTCVCPGPVDTEFFEHAGDSEKMSRIKKLAMAKPQPVVRKALLDAARHKDVSVYGLSMKGTRLMAKAVPHRLLLPVMGRLFKEQENTPEEEL